MIKILYCHQVFAHKKTCKHIQNYYTTDHYCLIFIFCIVMRLFTLLGLFASIIIGLSPQTLAQTTAQPPIPDLLQQQCRLTPSGLIDYCPEYWLALSELNRSLAQQRSESPSQEALITLISDTLAQLRTESSAHHNTMPAGQAFLHAYKEYIHEYFLSYLTTEKDDDPVKSFWQQTYFDADQSGLGLLTLGLYKKHVNQYDTSMTLQIAVRNFTPNTINNIEDLYCFTTINDQDYIYPMNIQPTFQANSITNLIIDLKAGISPLFEKISQQKIACTLVYTQFGSKKYTNRTTLAFDITK